MKKNYFKSLFVFLIFISISNAYAMGDPLVVYSFFGAGILQLIIAASFLVVKSFSSVKYKILFLYLLNMIPLWLWVFDFRGPDFELMYIGLFSITIGTYLLIYYIVQKLSK